MWLALETERESLGQGGGASAARVILGYFYGVHKMNNSAQSSIDAILKSVEQGNENNQLIVLC